MYSFLRQSIRQLSDKYLSSNNSISSALNEESRDADSDSSDDSIETQLIGGHTSETIVAKEPEESNEWFDDEWNAIESELNAIDDRNKHLKLTNEPINGVVTHVSNSNEVVVNGVHRCVYQRCTFGDIQIGDLVHIEANELNAMIVKPLRYKYLTGKITEFDGVKNRFVFSNHAFMSRNEENQHLKVNDVIKCFVIEVNQNKYKWRAIFMPRNRKIEEDNNDEIKEFTDDLLEDKNGIIIMNKIDFSSMKLNSKKSALVWIKNKDNKAHKLIDCLIEDGETQVSVKGFQISYGIHAALPLIIQPFRESYVELELHAKYCGDNYELLTFVFEGFKIGRYVSGTVYDINGEVSANSNVNRLSSRHRPCRLFGDDTWLVRGERLWQSTKHLHNRLANYQVPEKLWRALENNWNVVEVFELLPQPLTIENYQNKFHALIYLEECENHMNMRQYDMESVRMKHEGRYIVLNVPGLADGRPSLIISDKALCYQQNQTDDKNMVFEGIIHEIRRDDLLLRFGEQFHKDYAGEYFNVTFQMGRTLYRRCHHAIGLARDVGEQVLFPNQIILKKQYKTIPFESIKWFNNLLNAQQKLAVVGVLRGECRPTPYIIFGPPGTGKTVTIVESILQVFTKLPQSRIIACTSANSSADLIATKLLESKVLGANDLIRITAFHRQSSIPEAVKSVSRVADEDENKWLFHRIIVTTTCQAGIVFRHKVSPSHFSHVFIDEAAQCWEPESLIPISLSGISHGCIVLAGDHYQLGPVCMSQKAKAYGLSQSLMERLMSFAPYERSDKFIKYGRYNPKFITKLIMNYRSDREIMTIPSKLFYENELLFDTKSDTKLIQQMGFKSAAIFTGIRGSDRQDPDCPSWYNPEEVVQCCTYLEQLYELGVKPAQIGIITPYRKQVLKIRGHIHNLLLNECKVATIEEFQGDERPVIIVSMVRSKQQLLEHDLKYNLGFVYNPKRFNVALSRAMSLLICVGDPYLLCRDKCWKAYIDYCLENESYVGCKYRNYTPPSYQSQ